MEKGKNTTSTTGGTLDGRHLVHVDLHFDEHRVVTHIVELFQHSQLAELLRAKRCVTLGCWPTEEGPVLLDGIRFHLNTHTEVGWRYAVRTHRVRDVLARGWILALVEQGECTTMSERPR